MAGFFSETVDVVERHPFWIAGGVGALLLLYWFWPSSSASSAPGNFTFTYGPSDANIAAGTQLAMQQAADQTAVSVQTMQTQAQQTMFGDYINYLTQNSANQLTATTGQQGVQSQAVSAQQGVDYQQIASQNQANVLQTQTNQAALAAQTNLAGIAAQNNATLASIAAQNAQAVAQINASAATQIAATQAQANLVSSDPNAALVSADYETIFGHAPDPAGEAYWTQELSAGTMSAANLQTALIAGAQGGDIAAAQARGY